MRTRARQSEQLQEQAGYFEVPGAHLYTVLHPVANPIAHILLVGPFASERHSSYLAWARWARYLAAQQVEVLRYDYRGIGESTGDFSTMSFDLWMDDVLRLGKWLRERAGNRPFVLHGLEMGGMLAAHAFHKGMGDALLLWSPPATANEALRSTLVRWASFQHLFKAAKDRKPPTYYIGQLEEKSLVVSGYEWTANLWRASLQVEMPVSLRDSDNAPLPDARPVRAVKLKQSAAPFVKGGAVGFHESKDFSQFFATHYEWLASAFAKCRPSASHPGTSSGRPVQAITTREVFTLDADGSAVCGTFHHPSGYSSGSPQPYSGSSIGLIFINAFSTPRAYIGDAAVSWAEHCAAQGYPSFRLDLPGLGDSGGPTPPELLSFITAGGYAAAVSSYAKELMERFHLSGVIFVGHCAGAVTSIFTAGLVKECKGLILMDPYFHSIASVGSRLRLRFTSWAKQRRLAAPLSMVYAKIRAMQRALLRSDGLPANANLPLLGRWRQVTTRGLPVLTLMSPEWGTSSSKDRADLFDYTGHIQAVAGPASRVIVQRVYGTDHSFTNHAGQRAFVQHVEEWLMQHFPLEPSEKPAESESIASTLNSLSMEALTSMSCMVNLGDAVEVKES